MNEQTTSEQAETVAAVTDDQLRQKQDELRTRFGDPRPKILDNERLPTFFVASGKCKRCGCDVGEGVGICHACSDKAEAYWAERHARDHSEAIQRAMIRSGLPRAYRLGARGEGDIPPAGDEARKLCALLGTLEVPGLFLFGESNTFKTTISAAYLAAAIRRGGVGRFVDVVDLMTDITSSYRADDGESRAEIVARYADAPMLVLDDLGQEKASHHAGEVLRQILDNRRREWRPGYWLIVTSNRTPEALRDRFDEAETGNAILHRIAQLTIAVRMDEWKSTQKVSA